jgi:hypothetical protein
MVFAHPPRLDFSAMSEAEAPAASVAEEAEAAAEPIKKQEAVDLLSTGFAQAIFPTVNSLAAQLDEVRCVAFAPSKLSVQCCGAWTFACRSFFIHRPLHPSNVYLIAAPTLAICGDVRGAGPKVVPCDL